MMNSNNDNIPIEFEFTVHEDFDFAQVFAKRFHQTVINHQVMLPDELGKGYIKEVYLNSRISVCIHQYHLKQAFVLKRLESEPGEMLTIKFTRRGFFSDQKHFDYSHFYKETHSAEITTNNLFTQAIFPANTDIDFAVMTLSRKTLVSLLQLDDRITSLNNIILNNPSFVLNESMNTQMERTLLQMQAIDSEAHLSKLQYETKVYELIFQFFNKLLARNFTGPISINQADAEKIYALKYAIIADLSIAPELPLLARNIGMSETKMKLLFHQVFGQSIYNCFQSARMNEAARLLSKLSVSETGYKLGFTNLSHFSRVFEKHHLIKPKRYKDSLGFVNNGLHLQHEPPDQTIL